MKQAAAFFVCLFFCPASVAQTPPVCVERYMHVSSYGDWTFNGEVWSLPFQCDEGTKAAVEVTPEGLSETGLAVYGVVSAATAQNPFRKFTVPCTAMLKYCNYMTMQRYFGVHEVFYQ